MSVTFDQMIDETQAYLRSFTRDQEMTTWLTFGVTANATSLRVNDPKIVSRGRIEVGTEIMLVESVDAESSTCAVPPFGRGVDGTTAAAHDAGSKVTVQPLFPRAMVASTLNQVIHAVSSRLWGIERVDLTAHPTRVSYELPAETERVLSVSYYADSINRDVVYARDWTFDQQASWDSGKGLLLYDYPRPGETIMVTTARQPVALAAGDLFSDSLLPESSYDVIVLGAVSKLVGTTGSAILNTRAIGAATSGQQSPTGEAIQMARHYYSLHQERLDQEVQRLLNTFSNRAHYLRG